MARGDLTIVYDEDCGFCRAGVGLLLMLDRRRAVEAIGFREAERRGLTEVIPPGELRRSWHAVDRAGRRHSGGAALAPFLEQVPGGRLPARLLRAAPGVVETVYEFVARNRGRLGRVMPAWLRERGERSLRRRGGTVEQQGRSASPSSSTRR